MLRIKDRGQKSEVGDQMSEVRGRRSKGRGLVGFRGRCKLVNLCK